MEVELALSVLAIEYQFYLHQLAMIIRGPFLQIQKGESMERERDLEVRGAGFMFPGQCQQGHLRRS